jgi:hypothetical protein
LTRRQLLGRAGVAVASVGGLAAAGVTGFAGPGSAAAASTGGPGPAPAPTPTPGEVVKGVLHFVSRPDLTPPAVTIARQRGQAVPRAGDPPYFIVAAAGYPRTGPGEPGLMRLNRSGGIVWYSPNTGFPPTKGMARTDLNVQSYQGQPVLTWWEGHVAKGVGYGQAVIADSSYGTVATITGGNGLQADLHEFVVTAQDTALITAYRPVTTDLSPLGGPTKGVALSGTVLEIDIATQQVLFEWDSIDHVPVTDTYVPFSGGTKAAPFDYLHINSIAVAEDGGLVVSARNTCTVYKVARPSGQVVWRLGGKRSSFRMGPGATFWWQHHARPHGQSTLSLFDDGATPAKERQSRAILLNLDDVSMSATLTHSYTHPKALLAANQGSMQVLADGRIVVGWGNLPYFSEFAADGTLLLDGQFPAGDQSYRALAGAWTGYPTDRPALAARPNRARGSTVYASWNGATQLASWTVLAGPTPTELKPVGSQEHTPFETAITVNTTGPYFAVTAFGADKKVLGQSATVRIANG